MTRRLRVASLVIQPVLMWDDGEELTTGPQVQPMTLSPSQVQAWLAALPGEVARLESGDIQGAE